MVAAGIDLVAFEAAFPGLVPFQEQLSSPLVCGELNAATAVVKAKLSQSAAAARALDLARKRAFMCYPVTVL